ncbi:MAG TPA: phage head closure protein [Candidatus Paceibacterota bacterium]|nr:phage head closure protein [Candidatus Paceibacterota bacterium]
MITSGFNKYIVFERETTSTNEIGTPVETYSFLKHSWANFRLLGGNTQYTEVGALPNSEVEFTVRYDPSIDYSCRIWHDNQYYKILHIFTDGRKDYTRIRAIVFEEE